MRSAAMRGVPVAQQRANERRLATLVAKERAVPRPVEVRAGVGFTAGCHVRVADDVGNRISRCQRPGEAGERLVLQCLEWHIVSAFELDTDRKIVALRTPVPRRDARVPRTLYAGDKLKQRAITSHQKVRRHAYPGEAAVIRVRGGIEPVLKKRFDGRSAEFPGREADRVHDEKVDVDVRGTLVAVR